MESRPQSLYSAFPFDTLTLAKEDEIPRDSRGRSVIVSDVSLSWARDRAGTVVGLTAGSKHQRTPL